MKEDIYKTIIEPAQGDLFKDKGSKFYSYAFPVNNENDVKKHLEKLKKEHTSARHWCYAYQIGTEKTTYRANDDGEPNNSAGLPIYSQIQSHKLTNILIVIVRYFGGTKLGVSGLINAYKTAASLSLESSTIIEKTINSFFTIEFEYKNMSKVMRILKENQIEITKQKLEMSCLLELSVRKSNSSSIKQLFDDFFGVKITEL